MASGTPLIANDFMSLSSFFVFQGRHGRQIAHPLRASCADFVQMGTALPLRAGHGTSEGIKTKVFHP